MSKYAKLGMWRCRDGKVRTVTNIEPAWVKRPAPLEGYGVEDGRLISYRWYVEGNFSFVASSRDLIEHLSDEIADPRTWQPPIVLCEGVWEFDDGSRGVVRCYPDGSARVFFLTGKYEGICESYSSSGKSIDGAPPRFPRATRFIGPLPTGEK